ncbi:cytidylyltransferase domain-containing protein [Desulfovibrio ferrophilus]|uniref:Acylneuraminate cytidylyltransferase n=1 Tax=Desulfovibrio ferrophilus TaxID=241368 RepID=A0A2Z6B1D0_9BACT|nr:acylneuraminate cytidylyltransferase family protein [Desulfovibrio ferrophilus]BBD09322.1 acylneuraminate cytidylyltransferase [Desulfovibrio ferrophilus]
MFQNRKILAVIPARGGSKGVPRKNIRPVADKPLLAWTAEEARKSRFIDRLILSSDDLQIIDAGKSMGLDAPFVRPRRLGLDHITSEQVVHDILQRMSGYDYVLVLQPTTPLRSVEDIDGCIRLCIERSSKTCVTVTQCEHTPYWMYNLDESDTISPLIQSEYLTKRRQEIPPVYMPNGAVFMAETSHFLKTQSFHTKQTLAYVMPRSRSLDIDTEDDLIMADLLLRRRAEYRPEATPKAVTT